MITILSIAGVLIVGVAVFRTGRSPLTLLIRAGLHLQAAWIWTHEIAWPILMRERCKYRHCFDAAHARVVESAPPAATREPVADEVEAPPGSPDKATQRWAKRWGWA